MFLMSETPLYSGEDDSLGLSLALSVPASFSLFLALSLSSFSLSLSLFESSIMGRASCTEAGPSQRWNRDLFLVCTVLLDPRDPLLQSERTQGFTAGPVYGRAKCLPMLGAFKT